MYHQGNLLHHLKVVISLIRYHVQYSLPRRCQNLHIQIAREAALVKHSHGSAIDCENLTDSMESMVSRNLVIARPWIARRLEAWMVSYLSLAALGLCVGRTFALVRVLGKGSVAGRRGAA